VSSIQRNGGIFGRRIEPHTVIIAHGDKIRHFTVQPWIMAACGVVVFAFGIGYLMATSYLVFRDDLIGASIARQARMQHAYEDRISALRGQVDRIISRQLLDQELMEQKVAQLMDRQNALFERNSRLGPLLERAGAADIGAEEVPVPSARPDSKSSASLFDFNSTGGIKSEKTGYEAADLADETFMSITASLKAVESAQISRLEGLISDADATGKTITKALKSAGLPISIDDDVTGTGGPYIAADEAGASDVFNAVVDRLDIALSRLDAIRSQAASYPLGTPVPGQPISSTFGYRKDPLLGTQAFHSGIDFRAPTGVAIRSSGQGTVIFAAHNGGYGNMVEVKHAGGWTTRYAHMSRISVAVGQDVEIGTKLGEVGSTGRSTGPHLHYEVRKSDTAQDPAPFLKTGRKVADLL
jgi:murein DD-endopeptidase MepM/ murein hydrolase activator NlpD